MHCAKCDLDNPAGMRFCGQCRAPLAQVCTRCSGEPPPGSHFCGACGAALAALTVESAPANPPSLEERFSTLQQAPPATLRDHLLTPAQGKNRLVTLLFADMTGSVATTAGLDPEDATHLVNRLLNTMVEAVTRHGGRIDRLLGDGVLAVFGAPQAHENDPERAIRAALEIREAARELGLEVTAGINTGPVYVGAISGERRQERTVMGPAVAHRVGYRFVIPSCLEGVAAVAAISSRPTVAARLYGAAEALRQALNTFLPPGERGDYERSVAAARAASDETVFAAAWAEGRAMELKGAVKYALTELADG